MKSNDSVGDLRAQAAYCSGATQVILVSKDPKVQEVLRGLRIMRFYPDTTDAEGNWTSVFKVEVDSR